MIAASSVSDVVQAASLLVAALAIVYSLWYPELQDALKLEMETHKLDRKPQRKHLGGVILRRALPLLIAAAAVTAIFSKPALDVAEHALDRVGDDGWSEAWDDYDAVRASLVVIVVAGVAMTVHVASMAVRLFIKRWPKGDS